MQMPGKEAVLALLLLAIAALLAVGCGKKQQAQAASPSGGGGRPPAPVVVASVEQRDIPIQIRAIGNAEAYQGVQIRSQVNGQIERVHFKEGQDVRKGQLLFTLDKRPFRADLQKAIGTLQRDQAQAANSAVQATRYNALEQEGVVAHQLADQQRAQARADASVVNADRAAVDAARVQLQYTDIRAPLDARAGVVLITMGNLIKANDTPFLVQLNQITPIYLTFSVPEAQIDEVRRLAANRLKVLAYPKGSPTNPVEGYLTFIDNAVDTQTGTVKLKATFVNKDRRLLPGEFVDVVLNLSTQKNAIVVPTKSIQSGQQGDYVYAVNDQSIAEARPVVASGTYQDLTIISNGLQPGEKVVTEGHLRVVPNSKVVVQSTAPTGAPQNNPPASSIGNQTGAQAVKTGGAL